MDFNNQLKKASEEYKQQLAAKQASIDGQARQEKEKFTQQQNLEHTARDLAERYAQSHFVPLLEEVNKVVCSNKGFISTSPELHPDWKKRESDPLKIYLPHASITWDVDDRIPQSGGGTITGKKIAIIHYPDAWINKYHVIGGNDSRIRVKSLADIHGAVLRIVRIGDYSFSKYVPVDSSYK